MDEWPDARLPHGEPCFLVVDGLGTSSDEITQGGTTLKPWLSILQSALPEHGLSSEEVAMLRGFSYSCYGQTYQPPKTSMAFNPASALLKMRAQCDHSSPEDGYCPGEASPITYLTFSFGGAVTLLALAAWLDENLSAHDAAKIRAIILIQPGFDIGTQVRRAADDIEGLPAPIRDVYDNPMRVHSLIRDALATIRHRRIPIRMVYWPGDEFVRCDDTFLRGLGLTKGYRIAIQPTFSEVPEDKRENHYFLHGAVARDAEIHRAIAALLRDPQRRFWPHIWRT